MIFANETGDHFLLMYIRLRASLKVVTLFALC